MFYESVSQARTCTGSTPKNDNTLRLHDCLSVTKCLSSSERITMEITFKKENVLDTQD